MNETREGGLRQNSPWVSQKLNPGYCLIIDCRIITKCSYCGIESAWRIAAMELSRKMSSVATGSCIAVLGVAGTLHCSAARADTIADFYRGKTINVYIGVNVGGGYDFEARLLALFMKARI